MNPMFHHDVYRDVTDHHHAEARQWARDRSLSRLARKARERHSEPSRNARLMAVLAPMTALLILIGVAALGG